MNKKTAQRIIDHWHIGTLRAFSSNPEAFRVSTNQGVFYLLEISRKEWQSNLANTIVEGFVRASPNINRLSEPPFVHVMGYYYSAFRYDKKQSSK